MPIKMSRPTARKNGVLYLRIRIPTDLVKILKGQIIHLPRNGQMMPVKAADKIVLSLATKDPTTAKLRHAEASAAVLSLFEALRRRNGPHRAEPNPIWSTPIALSRDEFSPPGAARPDKFDVIEHKPDEQRLGDHRPNILWQDPALLEVSRQPSRKAATLITPTRAPVCLVPPALAADLVRITAAFTHPNYQAVCTQLPQVSTQNKYQPEPAKIHVDMRPKRQAATPSGRTAEIVTLDEVCAAWGVHNVDKKADSTLRRYAPSHQSLCRFLNGKDVRAIDDDDIYAWAVHRRDVDKVSPFTVNGNDLVAAAALFTFTMSRDGKRIRKDNPVTGVKLDLPKRRQMRDKVFRATEISAILTLARKVKIDPHYPRASASRRWAPWIASYTGARIQEICWLSKRDIRQEGATWIFNFPMTKDSFAREVPLHEGLLEEGFLAFWRAAPEGYLFIDDIARKKNLSRPPQEQRAGEIGAWIRSSLDLDKDLSPNHSWRHTFLTRAESAGISKRMANAVAGHNRKRDASDGYIHPPVCDLKRELDKFPLYIIYEADADRR